MDCEPFARYRTQLTALAGEQAARLALDRAGHLWRTPSSCLHWTLTFGRFYPGQNPYAIQVFEARHGDVQRIARLEAFETPVTSTSDEELWTTDAVIGLVRITTLTADSELATLSSVLNHGATLVRYHPGLRCTVRSVRNGHEVYGKVFRDDRGCELRDDYERLWRASAAGELSFDVARPIAWDAENRTFWQAALLGCAVRPGLRTSAGPALARRIGEALGSLAQSQVPARRVVSVRSEMDRALRHSAELVCRVPSLGDEVDAFLARIAIPRDAEPSRAPRPIHGAPAPTQWLATTERLGLVDFDGFAAGDPELDVARVLADLDFEDLPRDSVRALGTELIAGWHAVAGRLDPVLLEWYRAHRHLRKALRAASAIRPDGDHRAAALLSRSAALLAHPVTA